MIVEATRTTSEAAERLGFSVPVACGSFLGQSFLLTSKIYLHTSSRSSFYNDCRRDVSPYGKIEIDTWSVKRAEDFISRYFLYFVYSMLAIRALRQSEPHPLPNKSKLASQYSNSFPGSFAVLSNRVKLFHTPTGRRLSSEYSSHITSPIQRDEENIAPVQNESRLMDSNRVTAVPRGSNIPPLPAVPHISQVPPPAPGKPPKTEGISTVKSLGSTRSAPSLHSALNPPSPQSSIGTHGPRGPRQSASAVRTCVGAQTPREATVNFSKLVRGGETDPHGS